MRQKIDDGMLDQVVGGTVYINGNSNRIKFTSTDEVYDLNCSFSDAVTLVNKLYSDNSGMGDRAFDSLTKKEFKKRGWI